MEKKFVEVGGVKYQVFICPKCHNELRFRLNKEKRRVHGACRNCMHEFEVEVDAE